MNIHLRPYRPEDEIPFKQSIVQLQEYERGFGLEMLPGENIAEAWFAYTMAENKQKDGEIYVAEVDSCAVGFMPVRHIPSTATK